MASISRDDLYHLFDDLVRCETRLYNAVSDAVRDGHGLPATQFEALRFIRDHPDCRVADIAGNFAAGLGATSKIVDRVQAAGWVARRPNPHDGRSALIALTAAGARIVDSAEATVDARLADLLASTLTAGQLRNAASALRFLRMSMESARVGLPTG